MRAALVVLAALALTACAPTLGVQGEFSPQSGLKPGTYRVVTVVPFSGFGGDKLARELEARLASATFEGKPYFTLVPAPAGMEDEDVDGPLAIDLGRRLGVDAVLTGQTQDWVRNQPFYEYRDVCVEKNANGKCVRVVREQIRCDDVTAEVRVTPRLIDARSGQIVYATEKRGSAGDRRCDSFGPQLLETQLLDRARKDAIRDIRFDLAPFERKIDVALKESTEGLTPDHRTLFNQGMDFAKAGDVQRACAIWRGLQAQRANTLALAYNMGVCAEAAGDLAGALKIYEDLARGLAKPDDDVTQAIARVRGQIAERERLKIR